MAKPVQQHSNKVCNKLLFNVKKREKTQTIIQNYINMNNNIIQNFMEI